MIIAVTSGPPTGSDITFLDLKKCEVTKHLEFGVIRDSQLSPQMNGTIQEFPGDILSRETGEYKLIPHLECPQSIPSNDRCVVTPAVVYDLALPNCVPSFSKSKSEKLNLKRVGTKISVAPGKSDRAIVNCKRAG